MEKQPIRIDTVEIKWEVEKTPFKEVEKTLGKFTKNADSGTKKIRDSFKKLTKTANEISLDKGLKELNRMESEIKHLEAEYDKSMRNLKSPLVSARYEAREDLKAISKDLAEFRADYRNTFEKVKILQAKVTKTGPWKKLATAVGNVSKITSNKAVKAFKSLNASIKAIDFEGLKARAKESLAGIGQYAQKAKGYLNKMGRAVGRIPAFLAGIGVTVGMKQLLDFANALQRGSGILQLKTGLTGRDLSAARAGIKALYNKGYGENWADVSNAFILANQQTGRVGAELRDISRGALDLSRVLEFDLGESIKTANTLMKQFGMSSNEAYDLIIQGSKLGLNKNNDMLEMVSKHSSKFAAMGFSGYEMFDMLKNSADAGGYSIERIASGVKELSKRGVKTKKSLRILVNELKQVENVYTRHQLGLALFGRAWTELGEKAIFAMGDVSKSTEKTTKNLKKLRDVSFVDLYSQLRQLIRPLQSELASGLSLLLKEYAPQIRSFVKLITDKFLKGFKWFLQHKDSVLTWVKRLGAAFLAFKIGGIVSNGLMAIISIIQMFTNPIGLVILGIAAIALGIYMIVKHWDTIKAAFRKGFDWLKEKFIIPVKTAFQSVGSAILDAFSRAWECVKGVWNSAVNWFKDHIIQPIKNAFSGIMGFFGMGKKGVNLKVSGAGRVPGMASGGVFKPSNPFLAVLGDQRRGNNIEAPENLLRRIVREESYGYTPASTVNNARSVTSESNSYSPTFNISINGTLDDRHTERKIKEIFRQSMEEYTESLKRRATVVTSV